MLTALSGRLSGRYRRALSRWLGRRSVPLRLSTPLISFTFDDFPKSALEVAGAALVRRGIAGTYYASFGLMGTTAPTGRIFDRPDLDVLLQQGHELGCHTFDHLPAWQTAPGEFEASVRRNQRVLEQTFPGRRFKSFSYPIEEPRPATKRRMHRYFEGCRAGGQRVNAGSIDANAMAAFFLDHRNWEDWVAIDAIISLNQRAQGWLIFATHDVCSEPTPYGCTPGFFNRVVERSLASGASVVSIAAGWDLVRKRTRLPAGS